MKQEYIVMGYKFPEVLSEDAGLTSSDLERMIDLTRNLGEGRRQLFDDFPEVTVTLEIDGEREEYCATLKGGSVYLQGATRSFVGIAGIPNFVYEGEKFVKPILQEKGKRLLRKFEGAAMGKHVVDATR